MGQALTGNRIKESYKSLLKTTDNDVLDSNLKELTDGFGNETGVHVNTQGDFKAEGTLEFGSLKDTGEDITIAKFVDEADGIGNNDNDTTIPTSAAVKDYVDTNVTAQDLDFQGDSGTGAVDLDSQSLDIAGGTGIDTSALDQTLTINIDSTVATLSDTQTLTNKTIDLDNNTLSNIETDNLKAGVLDTDLSSVSASDDTLASAKAIKSYVDTQITAEDLDFSGDTGSGSVDLDSQTFAITGTGIASTTAADQGLAVNVPATNLSNTPASTTLAVESSTGNDTTLPAATTSLAGVMTGADKTKLDGIEAGAEVNPTASEIKTSYESNSDTNAFTDAEKSKLSGIEAGAEVNVVTSVNTETGAVVLDADDIDDTSTTHKFTTASDISKLSGIETGAQVNTVDSVNSQTGAVSLDTDDVSEGTSNLYYTETRVSANTDVAANTAKISFDSASSTKLAGIETGAEVNVQANWNETDTNSDAFILNKPTIPTAAVDSVNTQTGDVVLDTDDISEGTSNLYYTETRVSANTNVAANTLKNSYPSADATKVGYITITQAVDLDTLESNVQTNNSKISFDSASSTKLGTIEENADVTDTANVTAAGALMDSEVDADIKTLSLPANTTISSFAQTFLDDADAATVRTTIGAGTSNLELGSTATTALAGDTTTITTQQAADIQTNNAKVSNVTTNLTATANATSLTINSSDGTNASVPAATTSAWGAMTDEDKTKLDGIATGATANAGTVTEVTVGTGLDVTSGTTTPNVTLDLSEFTDMTADMIETDEFIVLDGGAERRKTINEVKSTLFSNNDLYKVIGVATDHSSRVLSDSGTSEGATSIMQNFEILINN